MIPDSVAVLLLLLSIGLGALAHYFHRELVWAEERLDNVLEFDRLIAQDTVDAAKYECYRHVQRTSQAAGPYDWATEGL